MLSVGGHQQDYTLHVLLDSVVSKFHNQILAQLKLRTTSTKINYHLSTWTVKILQLFFAGNLENFSEAEQTWVWMKEMTRSSRNVLTLNRTFQDLPQILIFDFSFFGFTLHSWLQGFKVQGRVLVSFSLIKFLFGVLYPRIPTRLRWDAINRFIVMWWYDM